MIRPCLILLALGAASTTQAQVIHHCEASFRLRQSVEDPTLAEKPAIISVTLPAEGNVSVLTS